MGDRHIQHEWTDDFEGICESIRQNSVVLADHHKRKYFYYKGRLKYYRIPVIILSAINSVIAVGASAFLEQGYISVINCGLSLICGIVGSIELFFSIQSRREQELIANKEFYMLSTDIFKTLSLSRENRPVPSAVYLEDKYATYIKLVENSNIVEQKIMDKLAPLPPPTSFITNMFGSSSV